MVSRAGVLNPRYKSGLAGKCGIYTSWQNMKQRCLNPNHPKYGRYGGRGIRICEEWIDILGFKAWAEASGFLPGMTIDRIDNNRGYEPGNCRWVTPQENSRKKRTTKISFEQATQIRERLESGEEDKALADEFGVVRGTIWFIKHRFTHVPDGEGSARLAEHRAKRE